MAESRSELSDGHAPIDALDGTIADLAAFVGLWDESTVRGPAWRFGDIGRRIERALVVLGLVDSCLAAAVEVRHRSTATAIPDGPQHAALEAIEPTDIVDRSALEVLLAANESLVAYRRHHRSDVELAAAAAPAVARRRQPAVVAGVDASTGRARGRPWSGATDGGPWHDWSTILDGDDPLEQVGKADEAVEAFGRLVIETWFATPVNPMLVRGRMR